VAPENKLYGSPLTKRNTSVLKRFPVAAAAAITLCAALLRFGYTWRLGFPPAVGPALASAAVTAAVALVAYRLAGRAGAITAAFIWAVLPVSIISSVFFPNLTYAAFAGAFSLVYFGEGSGLNGRTSHLLWAGALAGVAAAFDATALALAAFYLAVSVYRAARGAGRRAAAFAWLPAFAGVLVAAATVEYVRTGEILGHVRTALNASPSVYGNATLLLKRVAADAAAMLFWDPLGFGIAAVAALAGAGCLYGKETPGGSFYAGLFVFTLALFNFAPTSSIDYAPMPLEPPLWLGAAVPAAILAGAAAGKLLSGDSGPLNKWAGSLAAASILAVLFINGNKYLAVVSLCLLTALVGLTLLLAGVNQRRAAGPRAMIPRLAGAAVILIFLFYGVILYL
jgi:hypothetical protein